MKCKVRKIYIYDFLGDAHLYSINGKKRLIIKATPQKTKNSYLEYFKTLEYGKIIKEL